MAPWEKQKLTFVEFFSCLHGGLPKHLLMARASCLLGSWTELRL